MSRCLFLIVLTGCAHAPGLSGPQHCALDGLVLSGTSAGYGEARAYGSGGRGTASASGAGLACRRPETLRERCEIMAAEAATRMKGTYSTGWRNATLFVGWLAFVVPGVVLYLIYDHQADALGEDADSIERSVKKSCDE